MRTSIITTAAVLALAGVTSAQEGTGKGKEKDKAAPAEPPAAAKVEPTADNISYALGIAIGKNLQQNGLKVENPAEMAKAISDIMNDKKPRFTDEEVGQLIQSAQKQQEKKQSGPMEQKQKEHVAKEKAAYEKAITAADKTAVAGRDYLVENGKRKEVKTTPSGLQYEVLKAAEGKKPVAADGVTVHYKGTLLDGTEFDSSHKRGQPAQFPLLRVVAGWTEGLQLMSPGAKYKFHIPSYMAYGEGGEPRAKIPGHSVLVFEIELISIDE